MLKKLSIFKYSKGESPYFFIFNAIFLIDLFCIFYGLSETAKQKESQFL